MRNTNIQHLCPGPIIPADWQGRHSGKPIFVIGNGPSLKKQNPALLKDQITIGVNRVAYWLETRYIMVQDKVNWEDHKNSVLTAWKHGSTIILASNIRWGANEKNVYHFPTRSSRPLSFITDPAKGLVRGSNIVYPAMAVAFFFGGNPIYLMGCDYTDYTKTRGPVHMVDTSADKARYKIKGNVGQDGYPAFELVMQGFAKIRERASHEKRKIFNLSPQDGSRLTLFPFKNYPDDCEFLDKNENTGGTSGNNLQLSGVRNWGPLTRIST